MPTMSRHGKGAKDESEHGENKSLDNTDEYFESKNDDADEQRSEEREHEYHYLPGKHVAEEPKCEAD